MRRPIHELSDGELVQAHNHGLTLRRAAEFYGEHFEAMSQDYEPITTEQYEAEVKRRARVNLERKHAGRYVDAMQIQSLAFNELSELHLLGRITDDQLAAEKARRRALYTTVNGRGY